MEFFSLPVSAGGFAVIAMLIIAGELPSTNSAAFQQYPELIYLGSVDGSSFYVGPIENVTREQAHRYCEAHNVRPPSLERESHRQFFKQLLTSNVGDRFRRNAVDPDRLLRLFWLRSRTGSNCVAAFLVEEESDIQFKIIWDICSRLAATVVCEGDA